MARILVDDAEYRALCDLRDGEFESTRVRALRHEENYKAAMSINRDQCARLDSQDQQLVESRRRVAALEREVGRLNDELERWKPATSSVEQPLFATVRKR